VGFQESRDAVEDPSDLWLSQDGAAGQDEAVLEQVLGRAVQGSAGAGEDWLQVHGLEDRSGFDAPCREVRSEVRGLPAGPVPVHDDAGEPAIGLRIVGAKHRHTVDAREELGVAVA
jgi:hypothetical protein